MVRLRRSLPAGRGWTRRRSGKGFLYLDEHGGRITDPEVVQRLRDLVVPPAWQDVWLSPHPNGHIQATGIDARGRRQYQYHNDWSVAQNKKKHDHVVEFARRLPAARARVAEHLQLPPSSRDAVLAVAFRMLDLGLFRIGGESYAEENGSFGLATLRKEHVRIQGGSAVFEYRAKSGNQRSLVLQDEQIASALNALRRRRGGGQELLAWKDGGGRWRDLGSDEINTYVKDVVSPTASAKDFRTWHATVIAAVTLSRLPEPGSATACKRAVSRAVKEVSQYLGNTPAVCRASYIDPRVIHRFEHGETIPLGRRIPPDADLRPEALVHGSIEKAVLKLLRS